MPVTLKATIFFFVCVVINKGVAIITTPIFTRIMSTDEFGDYSVYSAWNNIANVFISLNLSSGVYTQGLVKFDGDKKFTSSLQGLSFFLAIIWSLIVLLFGDYFTKLTTLSLIKQYSMIISIWASAAFSFWATEERVNLRYKYLLICTILISIIQPSVSISAVLFSEDKVLARIIATTLVQVVIYSFLFIKQILNGKKFVSKKYWLYALSFNLPLVPHYLSEIVLTSADRIMIDDIIGSSEAGIYSLAYSISTLMLICNMALLQTINPWIYKKIKNREENNIPRIAYSTMIIVAIANIFLIVIAPELVKFFAPAQYASAIWVIPPIAMSVYFQFMYCLFADFEFYYKKTSFIMVASIICAVSNIALNLIFIGLFGYLAAGYTTLFCYILYAISHYMFSRKVCKDYLNNSKIYSIKMLFSISGVFLVAGFGVMILYNYPFIRYFIMLSLFVLLLIFHKKIVSLVKHLFSLRSM